MGSPPGVGIVNNRLRGGEGWGKSQVDGLIGGWENLDLIMADMARPDRLEMNRGELFIRNY